MKGRIKKAIEVVEGIKKMSDAIKDTFFDCEVLVKDKDDNYKINSSLKNEERKEMFKIINEWYESLQESKRKPLQDRKADLEQSLEDIFTEKTVKN